MGAYAGSINLIIALIRNIMIMNRDKLKVAESRIMCGVLCGAGLIGLVLTWDGILSILSFAALIGSTIGYWTNNAQKLRLSNLVCASQCWLVYDLMIGSWGGAVNELVTTVSALISIYRYGWKAPGAKQQA